MKKLLVCSVAIAAIIWSLSLAINVSLASAAYNPVAGDLIKTATNPAVYYISTDNKRHLYVNSATFWTWYTGSWSNIKSGTVTKTIKIISQSDFDNIANGNNITVRPYSTLLKFDNSTLMYTVTTDAKLALVPNGTIAQQIYGNIWNQRVITIQGGFENDYTKDGVLDVTANVTADWKIYSNDQYGFQINYPNNWSVITSNGANALLAGFYFGPANNDTKWGISVFDKSLVTESQLNAHANSIKYEKNNKIFVIFNEGIEPQLFTNFYNSFKFLGLNVTLSEYKNSIYSFKINYPSDWIINDQSFTYNNVKNASLEISSPVRLDLPGFIGTKARFSLQMNFNNGVTIEHQKFIKAYEPGDQAVTDLSLDSSVLQKTSEYIAAQEIIKSATIISN